MLKNVSGLSSTTRVVPSEAGAAGAASGGRRRHDSGAWAVAPSRPWRSGEGDWAKQRTPCTGPHRSIEVPTSPLAGDGLADKPTKTLLLTSGETDSE